MLDELEEGVKTNHDKFDAALGKLGKLLNTKSRGVICIVVMLCVVLIILVFVIGYS